MAQNASKQGELDSVTAKCLFIFFLVCGGWGCKIILHFWGRAECTKIARFSAVAAAIFTAPAKIARLSETPRCVSSSKRIASEPRFFCDENE